MKKSLLAACIFSLLAGCASNQSANNDQAMADQMSNDQMSSDQAAAEQMASTNAAEMNANVDSTVEQARRVFHFGFDQSTLDADSQNELNIHAAALKMSGASVRVEGHADERGTREYNMALGERRAHTVRDYLVLQGVNGSQIDSVSYGEEQAVADCHDDSCWSQNRRAELILTR